MDNNCDEERNIWCRNTKLFQADPPRSRESSLAGSDTQASLPSRSLRPHLGQLLYCAIAIRKERWARRYVRQSNCCAHSVDCEFGRAYAKTAATFLVTKSICGVRRYAKTATTGVPGAPGPRVVDVPPSTCGGWRTRLFRKRSSHDTVRWHARHIVEPSSAAGIDMKNDWPSWD